jgi:hypothetical protein
MKLFARVRSRLSILDVTSRTDARIRGQKRQSFAIYIFAFALNIFFIPVESEPFKILDGLACGSGLVAGMIEIFNAQNHLSAERSRPEISYHESPDVA